MKNKLNIALSIIAISSITSCVNSTQKTDNNSNSGDTNAEPIEVTSCSSSNGINKIVCLADAFKKQLNPTQLSQTQKDYSISDAKRWSNLPDAIYREKRIGLKFGSMTSTQISYAKALLVAAAGNTVNEGWDELQQLLNADDYLKVNGGNSDYGSENYYIALLGTPSTTGKFEIQFGGHHAAFANTYNNGSLVGATPSFRGVEPFGEFTLNNKKNQPLNQEKDTLSKILKSFSSSELDKAKLDSTFSNIIVGPQKDGNFPSTPSGIKISNLSPEQKTLILNAIKTYVVDVAENDLIIDKYTKELDETYVSYSGGTDLINRNDYVRIDGPSIWIEYSCQGAIILSGTHPHSIWRDKTTDYGGV